MRKAAAQEVLVETLLLLIAGVSIGCRKAPPAAADRGGDPGESSASQEAKALCARRLGDRATRAEVARELGRNKVAAAVEPLRAAAKDPDPKNRAACLWALGEIADASAAPAVRFYLTDAEPSVRLAAAEALGKLGGKHAAGALPDVLDDDSVQVRIAAVRGLGALTRGPQQSAASQSGGGEKALEALFGRFLDDHPDVRRATVEEAVRFGPPGIPRFLRAIDLAAARPLSADNRGAYLAMIDALAKIGSPRAALPLVRILAQTHPDARGARRKAAEEVRKAAIDAFVSLGPAVVDPLLEAVTDPALRSLHVQRAAAEVFVRIGKPALKTVAKRILSWEVFPDQEELAVWVEVLQAVGGDDSLAQSALKKAHEQLSGPMQAPSPKVASTASSKPAAPSAAKGELLGEWRVVLEKALFRGRDPTARQAHLILNLAAYDGRWQRVWGMALGYSNGLHVGVVEEAEASDSAIRLKVNLLIKGDPWVRQEHRAGYTIDLQRSKDGRLEGTFTGTFKGLKVSGRARGERKPPRPIRDERLEFRPVQPGEHPRVLFRTYDLPRLRAKLNTPFGRAYFQKAVKSWDPISLGMLYQLVGDRKYADEARKIIESYKGDYEAHGFGSGGFGHRQVQVALAYDLCYDAWPDALKNQIRQTFARLIPREQYYIVISHANYHPCCNYYGPGRAVPAIGSLVFWGDKGPEPKRPPPPAGQAKALPPPAGYKPGKGVPVVAFAPQRAADKWIYAVLPRRARRDPLEPLGGCAEARPEVGTTVKLFTIEAAKPTMVTLTFQPLPADAAGSAGVDAEKAARAAQRSPTSQSSAGKPEAATIILYTVLKVAEPRTVGLLRGCGDTKVWLGGEELDEQSYYRLTRGKYPMLVTHATQQAAGQIAPRLALADSDAFAERRAQHALEQALWRADYEAWQRNARAEPQKIRWVDVGRQQVYWHYRLGIGDGGFQAETGGYATISSWYPTVYACAYRKMFGRDASPYPDVTHLIPRRLMQILFRDDGTTAAQKINSVVGFDLRYCAAAFPILPDKYKPAVLWAWNTVTGVKDAKTAANVLRGEGLDLAHAFLHYPLDGDRPAGTKPVHPAEIMPLTWEAPTFGFHCFRSGWRSNDDFIGQVFLKASLVGGWNHPNAGTFRLYGLGHPWVTGRSDRNGARQLEPVVVLPEDETFQSACGRLAYLKTEKDGSGILTINLDDVYSRKSRLYDRNLIRWPERFSESGITGLRAIAFDYSGKSGAPAMLVLIDKIDGGGKRLWQWRVPAQGRDQSVKPQVKIKANTFTLDYGDASMVATFVAPEGAELSHGTDFIKEGDPRHGYHGEVERVKATGGRSFFVVATFQRKGPPAVKAQGNGLDAKVTVGEQTIRFDGRKIVLGP